jgi:N,N'-diacetyllegionaminate synthase
LALTTIVPMATVTARVRIGPSEIGDDRPCFVIAEAGVNHGGDVDMAEQLVVAAKRAGADCVKFQTFSASRVASSMAPKAPYQLETTDRSESQLDMLRKLELDAAAHERLAAVGEREGIVFLSAPYGAEDVDLLESIGVAAYKVPSALLVEPGLLRRIAATGKPVLLSTGLATLDEVGDAVAVLREAGNDQLVVLQCTTDYPADPAEANLRAMQTMRSAFGVLTGYSDHTTGATTAIAARALGAVVIEKHITLDPSLPGPDQATSADPAAFREYVRVIRDAESALGPGLKEPSSSERNNLVEMRRSLVAAQAIPAGTVVIAAMVAPKRPATGIPPRELEVVVGRVAKVDIEQDRPLEWWMLG